MTCVAYDGMRLAADSLMCWGDEPLPSPERKIIPVRYVGRRYLAGFSGSRLGAAKLIKAHLIGPLSLGVPDIQQLPEDSKSSVLLVDLDAKDMRTVLICCNGDIANVTGHPASIGSGQSYAAGAMFVGATANMAVEAAIRGDCRCGGPVICEDLAHWRSNRVNMAEYRDLETRS